ncbi:MraY family glycosyltransferase [Stutzerimonas azotifigens]|uniref:Glycosyltransferase family 4 protein n=1 Tax=Stutzerimonas azotifigens TaxID=291995 RepID=A0ABR5Z500_9GAMM|nr:glycosyltransferase family 4 protein [Stutzerimonas azotifigens]MBA1275224.1 glycosyltransferase family 4 protein [Stutzerimonas azotifigens]
MSLWWLPLLCLLASWVLTGLVRRYALARSLFDIPNARSSHTLPTPRGGGVAIVVTFLVTLPLLAAEGLASWPLVWALSGAGGAVALLGFLDDHAHVSPRWRLAGHFLCATWALFWLGGVPALNLFGIDVQLGWFGQALAVIALVWLLNLYNFMDGIDGIASIEAITVCLGGALLYHCVGQPDLIILPALLAASVSGFLLWNFPPAKIFMGDAGSGFLGIVLGVFSLQAAWVSPPLLWGWIILLGVFVTDATFTLAGRLLRGDRVFEAHRSHAYQHASRRYGSHRQVSLAVGLINLFWLLPIAMVVALGYLDAVLGLAVAYIPLLLLAKGFRAGAVE